jgi:hypothetical protein
VTYLSVFRLLALTVSALKAMRLDLSYPPAWGCVNISFATKHVEMSYETKLTMPGFFAGRCISPRTSASQYAQALAAKATSGVRLTAQKVISRQL